MQNRGFLECDTLFYQGINCSQTQVLKYTGSKVIRATTGELMWSMGRNNLPSLNIIDRVHIGEEIADVNLQPFSTYSGLFNPVVWFGVVMSYLKNKINNVSFLPASNPSPASVKFHTPNLSRYSLGQSSDMASHRKKYNSWLSRDDKAEGLILYGVSRGTAATFCALAEEKYPEVKLVILEGAIDSMPNVISKMAKTYFRNETIASYAASCFHSALSMFSEYKPDGPSPLKSVDDYPENIPTVFITSEIDKTVSCENTERIAKALADRGKNDVYLLKLKRSNHPNYMYEDKEDRDAYEALIHAVYKKYYLMHDEVLAERGSDILKNSMLHEVRNNYSYNC